jgi:hypothetical protein
MGSTGLVIMSVINVLLLQRLWEADFKKKGAKATYDAKMLNINSTNGDKRE